MLTMKQVEDLKGYDLGSGDAPTCRVALLEALEAVMDKQDVLETDMSLTIATLRAILLQHGMEEVTHEAHDGYLTTAMDAWIFG